MKRIITLLSISVLPLTGCGTHPHTLTFHMNEEEFETLYDDSYFLLNNKDYHQEIALASFASAISSICNSDDYSIRSHSLVEIWNKENFSNIHISDSYYVKPELDSVGYGFASKRIRDFNLIAVTIRSGGYDAEWANNLTAGESGNVKGFQESADTVFEALNNYISTSNMTGHTKFWLSGYSRGGSITNLLAGDILHQIEDGTFTTQITTSIDDIYAYCFEPQAGAEISLEEAKSDLYHGIHNVMNFNDLIAMLYPNVWGMRKYGQNHYYSDRLTDINFDASEREKMVVNYHFGKGAQNYPGYSVDDWKFYSVYYEISEAVNLPVQSIHPSMGRFAHNLIDTLAQDDVVLCRPWFNMFQDGIRNIFATIFGYNPDVEGIEISDSFFFDLLFSYSVIQNLFIALQEGDSMGFAGDIESLFYLLFNANADNIEAIRKLYEDLFMFFVMLGPAISARPDIMHQLFSRDNMLILTSTHALELNYSFLRSHDTRLHGKRACKLNDGSYYILRIKTPRNVSIYEKTLKKIVFTYSGSSMNSNTLAAEKMYDGSINIYMPKNGQYQYVIDSDDIKLINVDEYNNETVIKDSMSKTGQF